MSQDNLSMHNVSVRAAVQQDLAGVQALYRFLNPEDPQVDAEKSEKVWISLLNSGLARVLVADIKGLLVSTCTLVTVPNLTRGAKSYAIIENVVTHPDYRRIGLGRFVLTYALKEAWKADCYKVMLATGSQRPETLKFYENVGFERGGKTFFQARRP